MTLTTTLTDDPALEAAQPAPAEDATAPVAAQEGTPPATPDDDSGEPKTLLDAALKAIGQSRDDGEATAAQPAGEATDETATPPPAAEAEDQGEPLAAVPLLPEDVFKALPKEARKAFVDLRKQVKTMQPDAERGVAVAEFIRTAGITPEEYVELQDVGALLKRDPHAARKVLASKLEEIDRALGLTLPEDIQQDVEGGYITEERARELSQARADAERATGALRATHEQAQTQALMTEVTAWEAETRRADPDFDRKLPQIMALTKAARLEADQMGQPIRNGAEAVRLVQAAYADVNGMLASFRPAPAATRPGPVSAASAPAAVHAPRTILEAARAGLSRGR